MVDSSRRRGGPAALAQRPDAPAAAVTGIDKAHREARRKAQACRSCTCSCAPISLPDRLRNYNTCTCMWVVHSGRRRCAPDQGAGGLLRGRYVRLHMHWSKGPEYWFLGHQQHMACLAKYGACKGRIRDFIWLPEPSHASAYRASHNGNTHGASCKNQLQRQHRQRRAFGTGGIAHQPQTSAQGTCGRRAAACSPATPHR